MFNSSYYLVNQSPWPLICSFNAFSFLISLTNLFFFKELFFFIIIFFNLIISSFQWWRDIQRESSFQGFHTFSTLSNIKMSFIFFIVSELLFFFSFFWAFFHMMLSPDIEIGAFWPPTSISPFNPYHIPFLNTLILLSSGFSITWAHHCIINKNIKESKKSLFLTIFLGMYFTILQIFEYYNASFSVSDSVFGSTFFITTGFHGIHVIIGSLFLLFNLFRFSLFHFSNSHHFSFEAAAWYWHFVDVIWLFLFSFMYWWIF